MASWHGLRTLPLCPVVAVLLLVGCSPKRPIYSVPDFASSSISEIALLPPVDLRIDKKADIDLVNQIQLPAATQLKKRGYRVSVLGNQWQVGGVLMEDYLREPDPDWIRRLGPTGARYVMVVCLLDASWSIGFGSEGTAELSGYLYDKDKAILVWRSKGIGEEAQAGLDHIFSGPLMTQTAVKKALSRLLATLPKKPK